MTTIIVCDYCGKRIVNSYVLVDDVRQVTFGGMGSLEANGGPNHLCDNDCLQRFVVEGPSAHAKVKLEFGPGSGVRA